MSLTIIDDISTIVSNALSKVKSFYEIIKDLYNVFINFLPTPLDMIVNAILIVVGILLLTKLVKMIREAIIW